MLSSYNRPVTLSIPGALRRGRAGLPEDADQLPYRSAGRQVGAASVEQVVAVSVSASIGYAAFYAAAKEFPDRPIILRHQTRIISRWTTQNQ